MQTPSEATLLVLWEHGLARHPIDRALLLGAWARPDLPAGRLAGLPLGVLGSALLRLRAACFGPLIDAYVDCEACGERLALKLDIGELLAAADPGDGTTAPDVAEIRIDGVRVRAPTSRDLAAVAGEPDPEAAALRLLELCCVAPGATPPQVLAGLRERIEAGLEALDPAADLSFALACERCRHHWVAGLDIGALLWDEFDTRARALLGEVHALARAYGWTEPEVLALSPQRRAVYLALVGA